MCVGLALSRGGKGLCNGREVLLRRTLSSIMRAPTKGNLPRHTALKFKHFFWKSGYT